MTHDNSVAVIVKFISMGASTIHNPKIVMTLDHDIQNKSESNLKKCSAEFVLPSWERHWTSNYGGRSICVARNHDRCE
jgi:hypothetical protein